MVAATFEEKRLQIIKNSRKIFARYGYSKTTLDDIAKSIGIKKNSLYYYFPNKESLFNEIISREAKYFFATLEESISAGKTNADKIKIVVRKLIHADRDRARYYSATVKAFLEIGEIIETSYSALRKKLVNMVSGLLREGIREGEFRDHNTRELAENLVRLAGALEFKTYHESNVEFLHEINFNKIDKSLSTILDFIIRGLKR